MRNFGIKVTVVEPGQVYTHEDLSKLNARSFIADYDKERSRVLAIIEKGSKNGANPRVVADAIMKVIKDPSPPLHCVVGAEKYLFLKRIVPDSTVESVIRRHWKLDVGEAGRIERSVTL